MEKSKLLLQIQSLIDSQNIECVVCHNNMKVEDEIFASPIWEQEKNKVNVDYGMICALATCIQCGYAMQFNLQRHLI